MLFSHTLYYCIVAYRTGDVALFNRVQTNYVPVLQRFPWPNLRRIIFSRLSNPTQWLWTDKTVEHCNRIW